MDGQSGPTTRPAFAKATQAKKHPSPFFVMEAFILHKENIPFIFSGSPRKSMILTPEIT